MRRSRPTFERNVARRSLLLYRSNIDPLSSNSGPLSPPGGMKSAMRSHPAPRLNDFTFERRRPSAASSVSQNPRWRGVRFDHGTKDATDDDSDCSDSYSPTYPNYRISRRISRPRNSFEHREAQRHAAALAFMRGVQLSSSYRRRSSSQSSIRHSVKGLKRHLKNRESITSLTSDLEVAFNQIASEIKGDSAAVREVDSDGWSIHSASDASSSLSDDSISATDFLLKDTENHRGTPSNVDSAHRRTPSLVEHGHSVLQPLAWNFPGRGPPTVKPLVLGQFENKSEFSIGEIKRRLSLDRPFDRPCTAPDIHQPVLRTRRLQSEPIVGIQAQAHVGRARSNSVGPQFGSVAPRRGMMIKYITTPSFTDLAASKSTPSVETQSANKVVDQPKLSPTARLRRSLSNLSRATFERKRSSTLSVDTNSTHERLSNESTELNARPLGATPFPQQDPIGSNASAQDANVPEGLQECLATPSPATMSFQPITWTRPRKQSHSKPGLSFRRKSASNLDSSENTTPSPEHITPSSQVDKSLARSTPTSAPTTQNRRSSLIGRSRSSLALGCVGETSVQENIKSPIRPLQLNADPFARTDGVEVVPDPISASDHGHVVHTRVPPRSSSVSIGNPLLAPLSALEIPSRRFSILQAERRDSASRGYIKNEPSPQRWEQLLEGNVVNAGTQHAFAVHEGGLRTPPVDAQDICPDPSVHRRPSTAGLLPSPDHNVHGGNRTCVAPWEHVYTKIVPDPPIFNQDNSFHSPFIQPTPSKWGGLINDNKNPERRPSAASIQFKKMSKKASAVLDKARAFSLPTSDKTLSYEKYREKMEKQRANSTATALGAGTVGTPTMWNTSIFDQPQMSAGNKPPNFVATPNFSFGEVPPQQAATSSNHTKRRTQAPPSSANSVLSPWAEEKLRKAFLDVSPTSAEQFRHHQQHRPSEPLIRPTAVMVGPAPTTYTRSKSLAVDSWMKDVRSKSVTELRRASWKKVPAPLITTDISAMDPLHSVDPPSSSGRTSLRRPSEANSAVSGSMSTSMSRRPSEVDTAIGSNHSTINGSLAFSNPTTPLSNVPGFSHVGHNFPSPFTPLGSSQHPVLHPQPQSEAMTLLTRKTAPRPRPPKLVQRAATLAAGLKPGGSGLTIPKTREEIEEEGMLSVAVARELESVGAGAGLGSVVFC
ncbi:hypothetical protein CF319_g4042 [Tilletia indica]|nr:hypothetical protein CF319_g4042 [Tilletia indica]